MDLEDLRRRIAKWAESPKGRRDMAECAAQIAEAERKIEEEFFVSLEAMSRPTIRRYYNDLAAVTAAHNRLRNDFVDNARLALFPPLGLTDEKK